MPDPSPPDHARPAADVVVVGAGAVGLTLALALARQGLQVLVLEAGPAQPPADYRNRNTGRQTGRHHLGLSEGRMMALGGTTRLWGGQLVPFGPGDFAADTWPGKPPWPIALADLLPWYDQAYAMLDVPQWARDPDHVWQQAGTAPPDFGPALSPTLNIWLPQPDFARLFGAEIAALPNLTVLTDCAVDRLEFRPDGTLAHVETADSRSFAGRHFVLANGTLAIAQTLLQAQATAAHCPFAANAHVGRGFIDHLHGFVGQVHAAELADVRAAFEDIFVEGRKFSVKLRASDAFLAGQGSVNCAATFNPAGSVRDTLRDLASLGRRIFSRSAGGSLAGDLAHAGRTLVALAPVLLSYVRRRKRSRQLFDRGILLGLEVEQVPWCGSYIELDDTAGARPELRLHWEIDGRELAMAATFCEEVARQFAARGWGRIELDPRLVARDPALLDEMHDAYHQMGGARMAATAEDGVVDRDLTAFGCENLSVCGAAVFPSGSFANPTLTALALAHRLAGRLGERLGG